MAYEKYEWNDYTWEKGQLHFQNQLNHIEAGIAAAGGSVAVACITLTCDETITEWTVGGILTAEQVAILNASEVNYIWMNDKYRLDFRLKDAGIAKYLASDGEKTHSIKIDTVTNEWQFKNSALQQEIPNYVKAATLESGGAKLIFHNGGVTNEEPEPADEFEPVKGEVDSTGNYWSKITIGQETKFVGGGGGTSNYEALTNKPKINGNELIGDKSAFDLGIFPSKLTDKYLHTTSAGDLEWAAINLSNFENTANKKNTLNGYGSSIDYYPSTKAVVDGLNTKVDNSALGASNGVAELDENGKLKSSQLPGSVSAIVGGYYDSVAKKFYEDTAHSKEIIPGTDKIYFDLSGTGKAYRWGGESTGYVEISASLTLGETSQTAYYGDKGKTAYTHSLATGNPHSTTFDNLTSKPSINGHRLLDGDNTAASLELQKALNTGNKLDADYIQDGTTNKVVTATEKATWNGKSTVSGSSSNNCWTSITINSESHNIPLNVVPAAPTTAGNYRLVCSVDASGVATYNWVQDTSWTLTGTHLSITNPTT